jgi:type III restriction enzyme
MIGFEVEEPILNSPYQEPEAYWHITEGEEPEKRSGRRPASYFYRPPGPAVAGGGEGIQIELKLVNRIRKQLNQWRPLALKGEGGVSRTTMELMKYWRREGRKTPLFFAQLEAAETVIFLIEARQDFKQGIQVPWDEPTIQQKEEGAAAFRRYAAKMATGSGKTTVMAMLAAWSILNKVASRGDSRFSDIVLVVCPNVTIRRRLRELDPAEADASLYRTRDLVPSDLMSDMNQGKVMVTNWHVFERQTIQVGGVPARVSKVGVPLKSTESITIGSKTTTARGVRYLTEDDLNRQIDLGLLKVIDKETDGKGRLKKVKVESFRYVESDTKWVSRILGREIGGKQNIFVLNDEAHHAYRIKVEGKTQGNQQSLFDEEEAAEEDELLREATVWVEGLDRIHRMRGINFCADFSATPFYLDRKGKDANRPFPWVVSDFGLTEAIESGLTKIPQLAVRDTTGNDIPGFFNIWQWIVPKLTAAERGGKKGSPKPEAILKWANHPIALLGGLWDVKREELAAHSEDPRPPVFIIVCKNTQIAKVVYEWLAEDERPAGIPPANLPGFRNSQDRINTIRVDTKVVQETDTDNAKSDEMRWMRITLDTVGKIEWPKSRQGRPIVPESFEDLAEKLDKPLYPPGRDVRCIVSVGMLTEGWDCNTVTHIIGLRPFMSQLLCEQVVGRGLRRINYELNESGKFEEEVATVFGVPFEIIPFKTSTGGPAKPREKRYHVHAIPSKEKYEIVFPRVEGYTQVIRNRVDIDWANEPDVPLDPTSIPPEVQVKANIPTNTGRPSLYGPGKLENITLNPFRAGRRLQELIFDLAGTLTREYTSHREDELPPQVLFPQFVKIVERYLHEKIKVLPPADLKDVFLSPYYGWVIERLKTAIKPDTSKGESPEIPKYEKHRKPGSTEEVDFWTSREVREVEKSHLNYVVADTKRWEQSASYFIDTHTGTLAFVKNAGLGFAIPFFHNGESHDYIPDFIIRLNANGSERNYLILETKGYDPLADVKSAATERWIKAVNADGLFGHWQYAIARKPEAVVQIIAEAIKRA